MTVHWTAAPRRVSPLLVLGTLAAMAVAPAAQAADSKTVTQDRLTNSLNEPHNWLMPNGNYMGWRYSKLTEIDQTNVTSLKLAFAYALGGLRDTGPSGPQNEGPPLVEGGIMYVADGWGSLYKVDVSSGRKAIKLWTVDGKVDHEGNSPRSRGIVMLGDHIFENLADGRVMALDRASGEVIWEKQVGIITPFGAKETFTSAPMVFDNRLLVANGAGDSGTRGWIASLDATNGREQWRFWTVPAPGEPGHETWKDTNEAWQTGGGGLWQTGVIDVAQRLTMWGAGNPVPAFDPELRPGDNLYSDSLVAVDIDTGKLKWYFQYVPNDAWNLDEGTHLMYDAPVNGVMRPIVGHFSRNGMYYQLDRVTGAFINGGPYINDLTWTAGLDPRSGKPIEYDPNQDVQRYRVGQTGARGEVVERSCPVGHSGVSHQPQAYNPVKRLAYGAGAEGCPNAGGAAPGVVAVLDAQRGYASDQYFGALTAVDVTTGKVAAKHIFDFENQAGVLVTAGNLVFTGLPDGALVALDDVTLKELWRIELGTPMKSPPMTYAIGTKQFLAVVTSGRDIHPVAYDQLELSSYVFVFAL